MLTRRTFLGSTLAAGALATGCPPSSQKSQQDTQDTGAPGPEELPPITPNDQFYVTTVSTANIPGESFVEDWSLEVSGLCGNPTILTLDQLVALGTEEFEHTLECIGNQSERLIGNARWEAVPLASVLALVQPDAEATHIFVSCGDKYATSIPLTSTMYLAFRMNGEPIPKEHGWPVRMLTRGRYGMKNPKWMTKIELVSESVLGFWEMLGWSDDCTYQIHSWIHFPASGATLPATGATVKGSAYAGSVPIAAVEFSTNGGVSWEEAKITYGGTGNVWALWEAEVVPPAGEFTLTVRAKTTDGRVQADLEQVDSDLDGFEGLHERSFAGA